MSIRKQDSYPATVQAEDQVESKIGYEIWDTVMHSIDDQVGGLAEHHTGEQLRNPLWDRHSLGSNNVRSQVRLLLENGNGS